MSTNKIVLRDVDQIMADYRPIYQPIFPLFNLKKHEMQVGKETFKRMEAVGDIRSKHVTPKDTVIHQIAAKEGSKVFKKYALGSQFVRSSLQDGAQDEDIVAQVLDEQAKHMDDLLLLGEGTSSSDVFNDGLFWNAQGNYSTPSSTELDSDQDLCISLHQAVQANAVVADQIEGRKLIMFYGSDILPIYRSVYAANGVPFKVALNGALGNNWAHMEMPTAITPASSHGWLIVNLDQVDVHYCITPQLFSQGIDDRSYEVWRNFLMSSCMVDVKASGAIIKQAATIEA